MSNYIGRICFITANHFRTPFLIVHGQNDKLCNPLGSELLHRRSQVDDKTLKIYPEACHQLFLELSETRQDVFKEIVQWIENRL